MPAPQRDDTPVTQSRRLTLLTARLPRILQAPTPELRLRLRTKLVVAMLFAALVPVAIVAALASSVILSSLEDDLREDADRQLTVAINLLVRSVERLGDETVQMSESPELGAAVAKGPREIDAWLG